MEKQTLFMRVLMCDSHTLQPINTKTNKGVSFRASPLNCVTLRGGVYLIKLIYIEFIHKGEKSIAWYTRC